MVWEKRGFYLKAEVGRCDLVLYPLSIAVSLSFLEMEGGGVGGFLCFLEDHIYVV